MTPDDQQSPVRLQPVVRRLWSAGDRMAGLLCEHVKGHPMNCQCEYDKALQEYLQIKRDHPEPSNGGANPTGGGE